MKISSLINPFAFTMIMAGGTFFNAGASSVSGTISNGEGKKIYFDMFVENGVTKIDSVTLDKGGKFNFNVNNDKTNFYRLSTKATNFIVLIIKPGEKISITAKADNLNYSYTVKGSKYSSEMKEFSTVVNNYVIQRDTISARFKRAIAAEKTEESEKLGKQLGEEYNKFIAGRDAFVAKYPQSPALYAVMGHLNQQTDYDLMKKIEKALETSMPDSYFLKQVQTATKKIDDQRKAEEARALEAEKQKKAKENIAPGKFPPDISMPDSNNVFQRLSNLKGQYVLVDFWASWCGPCRAENPNVVKMYNKYKDKGFTVYSVSLDVDRARWLQAIAKDGLTWPNHVSELKGWQTSILPSYGITGIPFTLLLDKEGKIVQTYLRGEALEAKLKEIFGY